MGWADCRIWLGRFARVPAAIAAAAMLAGCFQPLYGERAAVGGGARDALFGVEVLTIDAAANSPELRLAVQVRNDLIFNFTGGSDPPVPTHRLKVNFSSSRSVVATDSNTKLPSVENYALHASYVLTEVATNKVAITGRVSTNVSYDTLGTARFARISGMHDAERRAAKVVSDNITTRLASYFVAGG